MQTAAFRALAVLFGFMLASCGGGGGGGGSAQTNDPNKPGFYSNMKFMHTGGLPFNNGPQAQAQGMTAPDGTFVYEKIPENAQCTGSGNTQTCTTYYNMNFSICGTPLLPQVQVTGGYLSYVPPTKDNTVTFKLPAGYTADGATWEWLPTDSYAHADFTEMMRVANNVTRVSMMASTTTNLADGLQLLPAVATGKCAPFSLQSLDLATDTASMAAIAPNPLPTVDAGNSYLKELLVCRQTGAWQGQNSVSVSTAGSNSSTLITGDASIVMDVTGNINGYLDYQKNATAPYSGALTFSGALSLASDEIDYTVPAGSGPLSYTEVVVNSVIPNLYGLDVETQSPDGTVAGAGRMTKVGMYYFNPVKKFVTTVQGATNTWVVEIGYDKDGNVGGTISDTPHYKTVIALAGTLQNGVITFHAFDWNQGRPTCVQDSTKCPTPTDTGPEVAPPAVDGSLTVDTSAMTATGALTMASDSINAAVTAPGCYL